MPRLPVVQFNDAPAPANLPGADCWVNEIEGLALQFDQLRQVKQRGLDQRRRPRITRGNKRNVLAGWHFGSDRFDFAAVPTAGASA